jgi:hypothetical protein
MTAKDWRACADPIRMLEFLRGKASDRKLRLLPSTAELGRADEEARAASWPCTLPRRSRVALPPT